jgi:hypothetical protein
LTSAAATAAATVLGGIQTQLMRKILSPLAKDLEGG